MPVASGPASLRAFLEHPGRPAGTLAYHELQGFLFTVAGAPELIPPSEWLPIVFGEKDAHAHYRSLAEAKTILGQIMALYNEVNATVSDKHAAAPREPRRTVKVGRNDPCPCGSAQKFKKCCGTTVQFTGETVEDRKRNLPSGLFQSARARRRSAARLARRHPGPVPGQPRLTAPEREKEERATRCASPALFWSGFSSGSE